MAESLATVNPMGLFSETFNATEVNKQSFANFMLRTFPRGINPMFAMSDMWKPIPGGKVVRSSHGYHTKAFIFGSLTINNSGGYVAGDTTFTVVSTAGVIAGQTYQIPATREVVRVASVTNATTVVVTRAFGRVAAGAVANGAVLFCTGNAHTEASTRPGGRTTKSVYKVNYTSIFRNGWGITGTAAASATQVSGYNNLSETLDEAMKLHALDWGRIAIWSQPIAPMDDPATGKLVHATQGLVDAIYENAPNNVFTAASTTSYVQLEAMLDSTQMLGNSLSDGSDRVILTDTKGMQVISNIGRIETKDKMYLEAKTTSFGWRYKELHTNLGQYRVIEDRLLNGNNHPTGLAIVVDPNIMGVGYLDGRDMLTERIDGVRDGHEYGLDAKVGGFLTEMLIATLVPSNCAVINGLTAAA